MQNIEVKIAYYAEWKALGPVQAFLSCQYVRSPFKTETLCPRFLY